MNEYSKYHFFKSTVEDLFGKKSWYDLKESNHIPTWKKYAKKILKSIEFSINSTIEIYDDIWISEIESNIERGIKHLNLVNSIDEIISVVAATLINVSFLQIGFMPKRAGNDMNVSFRKSNWQLDEFRTVAYLQSYDQKEKLFKKIQRKQIGFENQMALVREYHSEKRKESYIDWCNQKKA